MEELKLEEKGGYVAKEEEEKKTSEQDNKGAEEIDKEEMNNGSVLYELHQDNQQMEFYSPFKLLLGNELHQDNNNDEMLNPCDLLNFKF